MEEIFHSQQQKKKWNKFTQKGIRPIRKKKPIKMLLKTTEQNLNI